MVEDNIAHFAKKLGLHPQDLEFLREHPAELQNEIIRSFDASGSKDGHYLERLQSYTRHMAKRSSAASSTATAGQTNPVLTSGGEGGGGASGHEKRYPRELLLSRWEMLKSGPPVAAPPWIFRAVSAGAATPKASRSAPPTEAPPPRPANPPPGPPAKSFSALRPTALDDVEGGSSPRGKASFNVDAPEFVPSFTQVSPAGKQPRTPVSLAKTIAEPEPSVLSPMRRPAVQQASLSSPAAALQPPRTPVSLVATIAAPESPAATRPPGSLLPAPPAQASPPPTEAPTLARIKSVPIAPAAPSRDAAPAMPGTNTFEYHLHRLLFMVVAKSCPFEGEEASSAAEPRGVLLRDIREQWTKMLGNDMSPLMEKCGYEEVEVLVKAIGGLCIEGDGEGARVVTTRRSFEGEPQSTGIDKPKSAEARITAGAVASGQKRVPPPPTKPAPMLSPSGNQVLDLESFVTPSSGKVPMDVIGGMNWGGYPTTPTAGWEAMGGWSPWHGNQFSGLNYPPPAAADAVFPSTSDVPEPPSSSAL